MNVNFMDADYMKKFSLHGKTAAVTGGLGLLGRQVSLALAQAGAKVLVLDIDDQKGEEFVQNCMQKNLNATYIPFNITDINNIDVAVGGIFKNYGCISVWVNAAYPRTKIWGEWISDTSTENWQKNVDMQMNSYCLTSRAIAELMKENNIKGSIINYGSTYGVVGPDFEIYKGTNMTNGGIYAAIKGGIINFCRYAASYYGPFGIRVNCLCPGGVFDNQNPLFVNNYSKRTPLRRMANPDEIASATLFLASDAASYVTGATFMVDGGWTCI